MVMPCQRSVEATLIAAEALTLTHITRQPSHFSQEDWIEIHILKMRAGGHAGAIGIAEASATLAFVCCYPHILFISGIAVGQASGTNPVALQCC
jgi:hypothetical protein